MVGKYYEISLPAVRGSLLRVYEFLSAIRGAFGLDEKTHFDIELATEEAITNVIHHAYRDTRGDFVLSVKYEGDQVRITIRDWGRPFDPEEIPPFDYDAPVEKRIDGGMGLHFMRSLMHEVHFEFDASQGNVLTMVKKLDHVPVVEYERIENELRVFEEVGRALSHARDVDSLLDLIINKLTGVVNADRGTLYLIDRQRDELYSKILRDDTGRLSEIRLKIGQGVAGHVAETGKTVNIFSASEDPHFAKHIDQSSGYETKTMLCTPMRNAQQEIIGVVQLLNKIDGVFTPRDEAILTVLSSQAAIAIENTRLIASEKAKRQLADTLREVSSIINSALELDEVLDLILSQLERVLEFEGAAILMLEQGNLVVRASRGYDVGSLLGRAAFKASENMLFKEMVNLRLPIVIPDVLNDPRWIRLDETRDARSWLGVPLTVGDQILGELGVTHTLADFYNQELAEVAQTFANQASAAIERARLYQQTIRQARLDQELETAYTIQSSLLPDHEPEIDGWDIAASWDPAQEVAGDFYDFIELPDGRIGFVLADVCGKGVGAALFMSVSRTIFRVMAQTDIPLNVLFAQVNNQIKVNNRANLFVTLFYAILDPQTGVLEYCNGGHNPPIFIHQENGKYELLESSGPALGLFAGVVFQTGRISFALGDMLVTYTDGVTEAVNADEEEFGEEQLIEFLQARVEYDAHYVVSAISRVIAEFTNNAPPSDDATIMVIKRNL